jgi:uncharacterized protein YjcR
MRVTSFGEKDYGGKFYTSAPKQQRHKKLAKKYSVTPNIIAKWDRRL